MTTYQLSCAQANRDANGVAGQKVFYTAKIDNVEIPTDASQMILSSSSDGTGQIHVDDILTLTFTSADSPISGVYQYDFYVGANQGQGRLPIDLLGGLYDVEGCTQFAHFRGQTVDITVELADLYKGNLSSTDLWLSIGSLIV